MDTAETSAQPRPKGYWGVVDTNATRLDAEGNIQPRTHEPVRGRPYKLYFDRETYMPEEHARKFLKDPSFIVTDDLGEPVASLNPNALKRQMPRDTLPPNMVIANLEELTAAALVTRIAQRPNAPRFTSDTSRDTMIRWLQEDLSKTDGTPTRTNATAESAWEDEAGAIPSDDMPEDMAEKLLTGA